MFEAFNDYRMPDVINGKLVYTLDSQGRLRYKLKTPDPSPIFDGIHSIDEICVNFNFLHPVLYYKKRLNK